MPVRPHEGVANGVSAAFILRHAFCGRGTIQDSVVSTALSTKVVLLFGGVGGATGVNATFRIREGICS